MNMLPDVAAQPPAPAKPRQRERASRFALLALGGLAGVLGARFAPSVTAGADPLLFWAGLLLGPNLSGLGLRLLARPAGLGVLWRSAGVGRWAGSAVWGGRLLTVRRVPLVLVTWCLVVLDRPRLRWRLWWTAAAVVTIEAAAAVALVRSGGAAVPLGWGLACAVVLFSVVQPGRVTSRAWTLFRLPFGDQERRLAEWVHDPATLSAARALAAGRLAEARRVLEGAAPSQGPRRQHAEVTLALAEGRWAEAAQGAHALHARSDAVQLRLGALQLYASALADGMAAGYWAPGDVLPRFDAVVAAVRTERPALLRVGELGALEAMLHGDPVRAARLAARAAGSAPDAVSRARALALQASALGGRPDQALRLLARADRLAPGLHRVASVRNALPFA